MENKDLILNHEQIQHKIKRIAYQIYETNVNELELIIAGIEGNGFTFAQYLKKELELISSIVVTLCEVRMDKSAPLGTVSTSLNISDYENKALILTDDVLNTGTSLIYGVHHFLNTPLKKIKTAVLVNRNHKKYPVKADFKGISLSTSLHDHITVNLTPTESSVFLT